MATSIQDIQAELAASSERVGRRMERRLGFGTVEAAGLDVDEAVPGPFDDNVIILALSVRTRSILPEGRDHELVELGVAVLDTSIRSRRSLGAKGVNWAKKIESTLITVSDRLSDEEDVDLRRAFTRNSNGAFECVTLEQFPDTLRDVTKCTGRNVVLVGCGLLEGDLPYINKVLTEVHLDLSDLINIIDCIDIMSVYHDVLGESAPELFPAMMDKLGLPSEDYGNPGYRAIYILQAFLAIAVQGAGTRNPVGAVAADADESTNSDPPVVVPSVGQARRRVEDVRAMRVARLMGLRQAQSATTQSTRQTNASTTASQAQVQERRDAAGPSTSVAATTEAVSPQSRPPTITVDPTRVSRTAPVQAPISQRTPLRQEQPAARPSQQVPVVANSGAQRTTILRYSSRVPLTRRHREMISRYQADTAQLTNWLCYNTSPLLSTAGYLQANGKFAKAELF